MSNHKRSVTFQVCISLFRSTCAALFSLPDRTKHDLRGTSMRTPNRHHPHQNCRFRALHTGKTSAPPPSSSHSTNFDSRTIQPHTDVHCQVYWRHKSRIRTSHQRTQYYDLCGTFQHNLYTRAFYHHSSSPSI